MTQTVKMNELFLPGALASEVLSLDWVLSYASIPAVKTIPSPSRTANFLKQELEIYPFDTQMGWIITRSFISKRTVWLVHEIKWTEMM